MQNNEQKGRVSGTKNKTLMLAQIAVLAAIMIILDRTGLGYFKIGVFSLTIMAVPMIIGGITIDEKAGMVLGGVFGITVLFLPETQFFLSMNPAMTVVLCVGVRVLIGFLSGFLFRIFAGEDKAKLWPYAATGLAVSLLNTLFMMGGIVMIFGADPAVQAAFGAENVNQAQLFAAVITGVALNAIIEAFLCTIISGTVARTIMVFLIKNNMSAERK